VALLHFLAGAGWRKLIVVHLNHSLRGRASDGDATFTAALATALGLPCVIEKHDVAKEAKRKKLSLETAARDARRRLFQKMARRHRCQFVFTAHHADDQAETVLHRLCRGASLAGAAGMSSAAESIPGLTIVRPLLGVSRAEIDDYILAHRLPFREDASNAKAAHTRNRVRHELMPLMNDVFQRDVSPLIGRFAGLASRDDEALQAIARELEARLDVFTADGPLRLTEPLRTLHPAVLSRIVHRWLVEQNRVPDIGNREVELAFQLLATGASKTVNLPAGARLHASPELLWVERPASTTNRKRPSRPSRKPR
jgi:tRNA(Ile)-lysidine synthase